MRRNLDELLTQQDTGQKEIDDKILKEAMQYESKDKQLFVIAFRMMGCRRPESKLDIAYSSQVSQVFQGL